ncbi:MAG: hypothetical protein AB4372_11050 [Xenococcus sp. (in: cyanobacteria)]
MNIKYFALFFNTLLSTIVISFLYGTPVQANIEKQLLNAAQQLARPMLNLLIRLYPTIGTILLWFGGLCIIGTILYGVVAYIISWIRQD